MYLWRRGRVGANAGPADRSPSGLEGYRRTCTPTALQTRITTRNREQRKSLRRARPPGDAGLPTSLHRSTRPGVLPRAAFPPPRSPLKPRQRPFGRPRSAALRRRRIVSASPGAAWFDAQRVRHSYSCGEPQLSDHQSSARDEQWAAPPAPPAAAARSTTRRRPSSTARAAAGPRARRRRGSSFWIEGRGRRRTSRGEFLN